MKKVMISAFAVGLCMTANVMAQVPSYVPTNGLVGYWPFNGNANDESGNGNNGMVNGATLTSDRFGNSNQAYSFDGISNFIEVPHSSSQIYSNGQTVSFWLYRTGMIPAGGDHNHILSKGAELFNGQNIWAGSANNYLNYHYISGNYYTGNNCYTSGNSFSDSSWVNYIVTNNLNEIKVYINGVLLSTCSIQYSSTTLDGTAQGPMNFGKGRGHFGGEQGFQGHIDDIGIWNHALTPQEISDFYNATNCVNDLTTTPSLNSIQTGNTANFIATTSNANATFIWQSDFGQGYVTLNDYGNYSGTNTNTLSISNVQLANHNQPIRAISSNTNCTDTSNIATIQIADTCITNVTDTTFVTITDTNVVTVYDTLLTTVTDTLIINTTLSLPAPNNENTILIYPNPASDHITIDNGNFAAMAGYTIKIENNTGQQVFQSAINQQQFYVDLSTWTGNGLYFVHLIDAQNNTVTIRKIVLQ